MYADDSFLEIISSKMKSKLAILIEFKLVIYV